MGPLHHPIFKPMNLPDLLTVARNRRLCSHDDLCLFHDAVRVTVVDFHLNRASPSHRWALRWDRNEESLGGRFWTCRLINTKLIAEHWDDLLRLAGSLKLGVVQATSSQPVSGDASRLITGQFGDLLLQPHNFSQCLRTLFFEGI
jgi:Tn3 transposase DDE domain